jgi:hypothetical protein
VAITNKQAEKIETTLSGLGLDPDAFRDWLMRRVYSADESGRRVTHYRRIRGSHGEAYVWDAEGTDELPLGCEAPRPPQAATEPPLDVAEAA